MQRNHPTFSKVLMRDFANQLRVPKKFVSKFKEIMENHSFYLKSRAGITTLVSVTRKEEGHHFFKRGWPEFVKVHDLREAEFLVFNYVGNRTFEVVIYAPSACEKEIQLQESFPGASTSATRNALNFTRKQAAKAPRQPKKPPFSHTTRGEIGDGERVVEGTAQSKQLSLHCQKHDEGNEDDEDCVIMDSFPGPKGLQELEGGRGEYGGGKRQRTSKKQALVGLEKLEALRRASGFRSRNPYFALVIQPCYIPPGNRLNMPSAFARKYIKAAQGELTLTTASDKPGGKEWAVKYSYDEGRGKARRKLLGGLNPFVKENGLEVGDVCVFELIDTKKIVFKVSIFKGEM